MSVLVAYDGSEPARKAVKRAFDAADGEEVVLLRVVEVADSFTEMSINLVNEMLGERKSAASEELSEDVAELVADDVEFRTEVAVGDPAREIVAFAEDHDVDQILVGSHGREGVSRILLGSVAEAVVRRAPVSVTVVR